MLKRRKLELGRCVQALTTLLEMDQSICTKIFMRLVLKYGITQEIQMLLFQRLELELGCIKLDGRLCMTGSLTL